MAEACGTGNLVEDFFSFLGDPVGTIVDIIARLILRAAISIYGQIFTSVETLPQGGGGAPTQIEISDQIQWVVAYVAVGSIIYASIRMALERRGQAGTTALKGILRLILVAGGGSWVVTKLAILSDGYTSHLFAQASLDVLSNSVCSGGAIEHFLMLVLAFLLIIAAIVQLVLLYVRLGIVILLLGTLPLAAVASMTDWGMSWWRKHIGWLVAWLLYKPAAALIMFAGVAMVNSGSKDRNVYATTNFDAATSNANQRIAGIAVLLLSAVALPALLKLIMPATAALGTGGSGATTAAAGAVASGALSVGAAGLSVAGQAAKPGGRGPTGASTSGSSGSSGGSGSSGSGGSAGGKGSAGAAGAALGPAMAAAGAAVGVAQVLGSAGASAVDGAGEDHGGPSGNSR